MVLRFLLRPAVLASVVVHGAVVTAAYLAVEAERSAPEARITVSMAADFSDAEESPPPVDTFEPEAPEPTVAPPVWVDPPPGVEVVDEPVAPRVDPPTIAVGGLAPGPSGLRTRRAKSAGGETPVAPDPAAVTAAIAVERRPGIVRFAAPRPENARPVYPSDALVRGHEGTVWLSFTVRSDGAVSEISVSRSSGVSTLDAAALAAAVTWRYDPKRVDGIAVDEALLVPVRFRLASR